MCHTYATQITTEVNLLNQALKDAVYKIISAGDKAANLVPLYLLVTTQVLPFANFLVSRQNIIMPRHLKVRQKFSLVEQLIMAYDLWTTVAMHGTCIHA